MSSKFVYYNHGVDRNGDKKAYVFGVVKTLIKEWEVHKNVILLMEKFGSFMQILTGFMLFCYVLKPLKKQNPFFTTHKSSFSENKPLEEFKRRFRRSGSLGMPFVSEEDAKQLKVWCLWVEEL